MCERLFRRGAGPAARPALFFFLVAVTASPATTHAHDPGLSAAELRFAPGGLVAVVAFARADADPWITGAAADEILEIRGARERFEGRTEAVELDGTDGWRVRLLFSTPPGVELRVRASALSRLSRGHRLYVSVRDEGGNLLGEGILSGVAPEMDLPRSEGRRSSPLLSFVALGMEHILFGYDHLLFLLALLVGGGGLASAVRIITSFTAAHSLTLALATFDVVRLQPGAVEPLIALSIVYVAVENLVRRDPSRRWPLAFAFGLVHGLGFATALRELGVGSTGTGDAVAPLLGFNAGVEIGQVAFAAALLPLLARWKRNFFATACSVLVLAAGAFWFLERVS